VQEFMLAQDIQLIAANAIIPLELVQTAVRCLKEMAWAPPLGNGHGALEDWEQRLVSSAEHIHRLFADREARRSNDLLGKVQPEVSLASCVVNLATGRHCKDPRDRIYAMLGIADDDLGIQPDYTLSAASVSKDFATRSLLKGELMILHMGGFRQASEAGSSSFVPDLSMKDLVIIPLNAPELGFSASTETSASIKANDTHTISIRGVRVGALAYTLGGQQLPDMRVGAKRKRSYDISTSLLWRSRINLPVPLPYEHTTWDDIVWWLIMLKVGSPSLRPGTEAWMHPSTRKYLHNRFVFQTYQGYIGIGPPWMKLSDQVVIFDGGATPFILRKASTKDGDSPDMWQLVADCYLLGWMDGNFFGHTVVDQLPSGDTCDGSAAKGNREKYLVRESFVLC
jgi:hypothetical protein